MAAAGRVLQAALASEPTLGGSRLVCIDGPAGSGKTTLAGALASAHASAYVVHMDDVYLGWSGLATAADRVRTQVVDPLRLGRPGRFRRYDWHAGRLAEWIEVPPVELLVIEGCASGDTSYADVVTTLVWVEAPPDVRLARGLARDGERLRDRWLAWQREENLLFQAQRTRQRADLVVDGTGLPGRSRPSASQPSTSR